MIKIHAISATVYRASIGLITVLAAISLALPSTAVADDIDVYRLGAGPRTGVLRIMLALDARPSVDDVVCDEVESENCRSMFGEALYPQLDLYAVAAGISENEVVVGADGRPDLLQADPLQSADNLAQSYWPGTAVTRFDMLRAAIRVAVQRAARRLSSWPDPLRIEIGLMLAHAQNCPGAGPPYLPDYLALNSGACSRGAYILQGYTDISDPAGRDRLFQKLAAIPTPGRTAHWMLRPWQGHPYPLADIYFELFRYLTGQPVFNGFLGASDFNSQLQGNLYHRAEGAVRNDVLPIGGDGVRGQPWLAPDSTIIEPSSLNFDDNLVSNARYRSPLRAEQICAAHYIVHTISGASEASHEDTLRAMAAGRGDGGLALPLPPGVAAANLATVSAFQRLDIGSSQMPDMPEIEGVQNVTSYFLVAGDFPGDFPGDNPELLGLAAAGGSAQPLPVNSPAAALAAFESVIISALQSSSSLLPATVAANSDDQRRVGTDIWYSMFRATNDRRWLGNVKKLKLVDHRLSGAETETETETEAEAGTIVVQAPLGTSPKLALSIEDGRILPDALTFWTDPDGADVQVFDPLLDETQGTDGRSVSRGGAGQQVPGYLSGDVGAENGIPGARQLFTTNPIDGNSLLPLDATGAVLPELRPYLDPANVLSDGELRSILGWIRGRDVFDTDADGNTDESRDWLIGDVMHSRPLAVNYGARPGSGYTQDNPDVRILFGTNHGMLHMLKNTSESILERESGEESWAFVPLELLPLQSELARRTEPNHPGHRYGIDGAPVSRVQDVNRDGIIDANAGDRAWVYIGQRRGGTALYALDISDPDAPLFKWQIDHHSAGFEQLALSFSTPVVTSLDLGGDKLTPVLVFGGGYHGGWTGDTPLGKDTGNSADSIGNAIYVVHAISGELIWRAVGPGEASAVDTPAVSEPVPALVHSIPAPLAVVDSNGNGVDDRAYVGDTGGNLWRVELTEATALSEESTVPVQNHWRVEHLAALGGADVDADRRFFHAADYVRSRDRAGDYHGVLLVSGNRAAPLEMTVNNFAYLIKDRFGVGNAPTSPRSPILHVDLTDVTQSCVDAEDSRCLAEDLSLGWKLQLRQAGEKGLSKPLVSNGTVLFTSYLPNGLDHDNPCLAAEGRGRMYAVRLASGAARFDLAATVDELEPADRYADLGVGLPAAVIPLGDGVLLPGGGLEGRQVITIPGPLRFKSYWRETDVDLLQ